MTALPALFFAGLTAIAAAGLAALLPSRTAAFAGASFRWMTGLGGALVAASAVPVVAGADAWSVSLGGRVPGGPWIFGADALSAFFLLAIALVGTAAAVYGTDYLHREANAPWSVPVAHTEVAALLIAMALVVTARAAVPFLAAWEVMAVAAFLLVIHEHERAEARRAGLIYLVATHTATLALIALVAVAGAGGGDLSFASLAAAAAARPGAADAILLLALLGFGLKAGIVPLHFWLPGAHAAAPSHVSALMSGLVIKTGIYGLLRTAALLGALPEWYGWTLLVLGLLSGVLGVVWALAQHDIKRLLAYHSVENIGIILIGMGAGALGTVHRLPEVAALGYGGAILHVLNHALFKGLLFLGAGAMVRAAGTRSIDALGGLARRMPLTWLTFLLGSAAIVGLPPLNGFISEWTIVRALLGAGLSESAARLAIIGLFGLGLIGGLALACFAKVNGVAFLGLPRTDAAAAAREAGPLATGPMLVLAVACVVIGLVPFVGLMPALAAARVVTGGGPPAAELMRPLGAITVAASGLILASVAGWLVRRACLRGRERTVDKTWACGYPVATPRMQYTASSFAAPVLEPFGAVAGLRTEQHGGSYVTHATDPALNRLLLPAWRRLESAARRLRAVPLGRLHVALLNVLATVLALLFYLALRGTP